MANQNPDIKFQVIDNTTAGVTGELDVYASKDFPLALTFSIKDVQDITKSKGSFSKSFKIPATRNNNQIFNNLFSDNFDSSFRFVEDKSARIYCDGALILEGAFKVKGHVQRNEPRSYECVVFGDNYKWVNALDKLNMCDIDFDAGGLYPLTPSTIEFGTHEMEDTWHYEYSGEIRGGVGTHIVFPLINTGKWLYGDFAHADDMLGCLWVLDIVKVMLAAQGYTLQSDFMNSDWFKRLISVTPRQSWENDAAQQSDYSWEYETELDPSEWKTPVHYRGAGAPTNRFDGVIQFDPNPVCPTCDPMGLVTVQSPQWGYINAEEYTDGTDIYTSIASWYWGQFGGHNPATFSYGSLARFAESLCHPPVWEVWGHDWRCVWEDPASYVNNTTNPSIFYPHPWSNVSIIQTPFAGEYEFNLKVKVEMDNEYVTTNGVSEGYDLADHDPFSQLTGGQANTGFGYHMFESAAGTDPTVGVYSYDFGSKFRATCWLMHYEASTGKTIPLFGDDKQTSNLNNLIWHGYYTSWNSGSGLANCILPATNLEWNLEVQGMMIDITDVNDKFFWYVEVCEEYLVMADDYFVSGEFLHGRTQCRYRVVSAATNGGLTGTLVNGGSVALSHLLPCDVTQLEWLNGLTGLFNLYWVSDELTKTIYVEPRDNFFYGVTSAIDWSDKIDIAQDQKATYVYDALKRDVCFSYEDDGSDGYVEERNRRVGQVCSLDSYAMDLGELYTHGETRIGSNYYAPTYLFNDRVIATNQNKETSPFIPVVHSEWTTIWNTTDNNDYPDKIEEFAPRLLLWAGLQPINQHLGATSGVEWRWGQVDPADPPITKKHYPMAVTFSDQDPQLFPQLNVGGIDYYPTMPFVDVQANAVEPAPVPPDTYPLCDGLYKVFWERNIENLIQRPKIKTAYFKLRPSDIMALDFRKLIYLELNEGATYWVINKIVDYKPAKNELTKVELFEFQLAKPAKAGAHSKYARNNTVTQTRDFGIGNNIVRNQENNGYFLGTSGVNATSQKIVPNITNNNPVPRNPVGWDLRYAADPTRYPIRTRKSGKQAVTGKNLNSFNIGNNNKLMNNTGAIVIGNNNQSQSKSGIIIGSGTTNENVARNPIVFQTGQSYPALVIDSAGNVKEGGGGAVMYLNAAGEYSEVVTEQNLFGSVEIKKVLKDR